MAKKIRQIQVEGLAEVVTELSNKKVVNIAFTGTTTKTLTITFSDGTTLTSNFTDLDTTYPAMTAALLNAGVDTTQRTIAADVLVNYINNRLSAVLVWKGTVTNFSGLPSSGNKIGDTYNIENPFTYNGQNYPGGSNVAWNGTGWDVLHGFIDTSQFLTSENDPKGVQGIAVTGTTTKTITITLRDSTTITGTFTDLNTTYTAGTAADLATGTSTTNMVWSPKTLSDFMLALGVNAYQEVFTIVAGNIVSGIVTVTLSQANTAANKITVFLNGVKQPMVAQNVVGSSLRLTQSSLPTPIIPTDEIEVFYVK